MQKSRLAATTAAIVVLASIASWLLAAEARGAIPRRDFAPRPIEPIVLTAPDAAAVRAALLHRAHVRVDAPVAHPQPLPDLVECQFLKDAPSGTTAKFDCVMAGGEIIKVKYNSNPEIHAEVAATRLLTRLGYAADRMDIVPRVRCYGCPRYPFFTMQLLWLASASDLMNDRGVGGYTDFEWVAVERKFAAPPLETPDIKGWGWFELERSTIPRAELDAFRLLAVFLAHWDNKTDNQRLVCLDSHVASGSSRKDPCARPLAMIQDLGATFGPAKVNLARWRALPIWADRATCTVTMRHLPWAGATFTDLRVSEAGRAQVARQLAALTDADVRALFATARFPEFHPGTDDERDLAAWTEAFRHRVEQIALGPPCPTAAAPSPHRSSGRSG